MDMTGFFQTEEKVATSNQLLKFIKLRAYSKPCQTSKMTIFAEKLTAFSRSYFCLKLRLRYLTGFSIRL